MRVVERIMEGVNRLMVMLMVVKKRERVYLLGIVKRRERENLLRFLGRVVDRRER